MHELASVRRRMCLLVIGCWMTGPWLASADETAARPTAQAVFGTPRIDGDAEELWEAAPQIQINQSVPGMPATAASNLASGQARLLWDQGHLYALIEVTDVRLYGSSPDPWQQDSVELFLDENAAGSSGYQADDSHYRVNFEGIVTGGANFDPQRFRAVTRQTETGYLVECAIQFATVKGAEDTALAFELQVNDNRNGRTREGLTKWASADNESWQNTGKFGRLILVGQPRDDLQGLSVTKAADTGQATTTAAAEVDDEPLSVEQRMPSWAAAAVFYQIFPERYRNGDTANDPTHASLEFPSDIPNSWQVTPWNSDWYRQSSWEKEMGSFFQPGVFHRRYGGDLQGVLDKIDYLAQLGINVIYFNPVFYARSLHKYDGNSYHHVDPYFGPDPEGDFALLAAETSDPKTWHWTAADKLFLEVVKAAHQRGIRVIIDGVFNHTGRDFFAFADLRKNQQKSPYVSWYVVQEFDDPATPATEFTYQCWWGVDTLPEFANNEDGSDLHKGPRNYIFDATRRWMDPNSDGDPVDGIDGWRLDVASDVPDAFWKDWNRLVRELNPQAYTVSEIWHGAADYLRRCGFSASMNYHAFAFVAKGFLIDGRQPASAFVSEIERRRKEHPWPIQIGMQNLLDSHDTDRIASMIVNRPLDRSYVRPERHDYDIDERASVRHWDGYQTRKPDQDERRIQRLTTLFQMAYVGAPMVYYGTEAGMWGGDDPCDRKPMVWDDLTYDDEVADPRGRERSPDNVAFDKQLFEFYQSMIAMRRGSPALCRGEVLAMTPFDTAQSVAMLRQADDAWALVVVNRSQEPQQLRLPAVNYMAPTSNAELFLTDNSQPPEVEATHQNVTVTMPRLSAACWTWTVK